MYHQLEKENPTFEKLGRYYLIALCAIATAIILSQVLVQEFIGDQEADSKLVNLSGRQRMLSQQISKSALRLSKLDVPEERVPVLEELESALFTWGKNHEILRGKANSKTITGLFSQIHPLQQEMAEAAERIVYSFRGNTELSPESIEKDIQTILLAERPFLEGMDAIVNRFDEEARSKVNNLKNISIFLMVISLGIIIFEIFFVFFPSARSIRKTVQKLTASQEKSKAMTLELSALYSSLEQAYQDLLEVDVVVEDFTVYAKCDKGGDFLHFSSRFEEVMEFEEEKPSNFFDWLNEQGYDQEYLHSIQKMVLSGNSWNGELKVVNTTGDFIWLKINIVPAMNEMEQVETLMIISSNETEKKEAEAISREINKERIAKKVKEQQFRSVLILEGQEEERKRISRDMHDGVGQLLSAMKFNLEGIQTVGTEAEKEKLDTSRDLLKKVIREVRRISFNLTPSALSEYGIVAVLHKFSREITKIADLEVTFENRTGFLSRMEGRVENNLYRIVQEAVNNAIKYAQAKEVKIILSHNSQYLHLEISDDGKGFDLSELEARGHFSASGHGIFNIRERANFLNGQCDITSIAGKGTTISIHVPLDQ